MNKTNTTNSTLNMVKSVCAERERKERDRLRANRLEMDKRDEAERERVQHSSNLLNSYIEKQWQEKNSRTRSIIRPYRISMMRVQKESQKKHTGQKR